MIDPLTPLDQVIGGRSAKTLATSHGVRTCRDVLWVFPRRYQDFTHLTQISTLRVDDDATVLARVKSAKVTPTRKKPMVQAVITDGLSDLHLAFFGNPRAVLGKLQPGRIGLFAGKVSAYRGTLQLAHPQMIMAPGSAGADDPDEVEAFLSRIIPVYPATSSVPTWRFGQTVRMVMESVDLENTDPVPADVLRRNGLAGQREAMTAIHQPQSMADVQPAFDRFVFEEAFVLQVLLARRRARYAESTAVARIGAPDGLASRLEEHLPFRLTAGQQSAVAEIRTDLAAGDPMQRLLHGEVGAGKTLVALLAMATVVDSGGQSVLLAPTEVLAMQHWNSLRTVLGDLAHGPDTLLGDSVGTEVTLLTGSTPAAARRDVLEAIRTGRSGIVVGTHALLNEAIEFGDLGLVVVDEQHRFGVEQRAALLAKGARGSRPHLLVMTATPIPRTVAMTVFGDLDVTTLDEIPARRAGVVSHAISELHRPQFADRAWERIREEVAQGRKAFVVCPRIGDTSDESTQPVDDDLLEPRGVLETYDTLQTGPLAGLRVGMLHGRMSAADKQEMMRRFSADSGDDDAVDVLVATSVIEVGVDVPDATVMVILDAERFGVSQLHQLRGRVGRGDLPGLCLFFTRNPAAADRLVAVAQTTNGFELAQLDLEQRREGDVLGAAQSGRMSSLRVLRAVRDEAVIAVARDEARSVLEADPGLGGHPGLRRLIDAWEASAAAEFAEKT